MFAEFESQDAAVTVHMNTLIDRERGDGCWMISERVPYGTISKRLVLVEGGGESVSCELELHFHS